MKFSIACDLTHRAKGLLPNGKCPAGSEALLIVPCHDVHTMGMKVPIDVAFIDRDGYVCESYTALPPGNRVSDKRACAVLERRTPQHLLATGDLGQNGIDEAANKDGWYLVGDRLGLTVEPFPPIEEILAGEEEEPISAIFDEVEIPEFAAEVSLR